MDNTIIQARNFISNIKARAIGLHESNRIDVRLLYSMLENRFKRVDAKFKYLSDEQQIIFINNVLIFAFTDFIIKQSAKDKELNVTDAIFSEVINMGSYIHDNMYPTLGDTYEAIRK